MWIKDSNSVDLSTLTHSKIIASSYLDLCLLNLGSNPIVDWPTLRIKLPLSYVFTLIK